MSIKMKLASPNLLPPFAICNDGGSDFILTTRGKHQVTVSRNGDELTVDDVGAAD